MAATISKTDNEAQTGSATVWTFTNKAIGSAAADRYIIVGVSLIQSGPPAISSVTCGGVTMASVFDQAISGAGPGRASLFILQVAAGTTATIVVTLGATSGRCAVVVWAAYSLLNATPTDTGGADGDPATDTLNINAGGVAVGIASNYYAAGPSQTTTWTNLTEDADAAADAGVNTSYSGASAAFATLQTGLSITSDYANSTSGGFAIASFAPAPDGQPTVKRFGGVPFASPNRGVW